jgi:uncharacterized protein (TIGR03437 family)
MKLLTIWLMSASVAIAQDSSAPKVAQIVNGATFTSSPGTLVPGEWATIFGTGLSDGGIYPAQALPFPQQLGSTQVFMCTSAPVSQSQIPNMVTLLGCVPAILAYVSQTQLNFQVPTSLPKTTVPGWDQMSYVFIVSVGGTLDQDATAQTMRKVLFYYQSWPEMFSEGSDCPVTSPTNCTSSAQVKRGAITDLQGRLVTSSNPGRVGKWYTIWYTGQSVVPVGKTISFSLGLGIPFAPPYNDCCDTVMVDGIAAQSPQYPGMYQLNFQVPNTINDVGPYGYPPAFPCGNYYWEAPIWINFNELSSSNSFPLVIKNGDVPCTNN